MKSSLRISLAIMQGEEIKSRMGERKFYNYEDMKLILELIQM
jgi:hypothetical protein